MGTNPVSEPAVKAARRAFDTLWPDQGDFEFNFDSSTRDYALLAAHEMATPILELVERLVRYRAPSPEYWDGMLHVLDALAPLIYATEEMES